MVVVDVVPGGFKLTSERINNGGVQARARLFMEFAIKHGGGGSFYFLIKKFCSDCFSFRERFFLSEYEFYELDDSIRNAR